jgi:hypothetical protein
MSITKHQEPKRHYGRTIDVPSNQGSGSVPVRLCMSLLNILAPDTINDYLKHFGWFGQDVLTWEQIKELVQLQAFLGVKPGYASKGMYTVLKNANRLDEVYERLGIDIEKRLRRIQNEYTQRTKREVQQKWQ